jgi:O-antigen/teichoic acid export membrane protein
LLPFLGFILKADWLASPLLADLVIMRGFIISLASPHSYGLMSAGRFKDLARLSQQEAIIGLVLGVILSLTVGVIGTALAYLLASCVMSAWQQTMQYFKFAEDTHWFAEWCAIWWRGLVGAGAGLGIAAAVWSVEQRTPHMPGYWAILAGGIGYGLPMGLVLLWWRLAKRVP